ncbi:response regulator [bacterium]|nr:response regulator [bacterium]
MKKIMIVDDSSTSRMFVKRCLQTVLSGQDETEYLEAGNGKEALAKMKATPVDLALIDLNMPVMDGATLLRWMKSSPKLTLIPVVVITSVDSPANRDELLKLGASHVLSKPVAPAKLMPVIHEILDIQADDGFGF